MNLRKEIPLQLVVLFCKQEAASAKKKECAPLKPNSS
jgi:hypothetical protein